MSINYKKKNQKVCLISKLSMITSLIINKKFNNSIGILPVINLKKVELLRINIIYNIKRILLIRINNKQTNLEIILIINMRINIKKRSNSSIILNNTNHINSLN